MSGENSTLDIQDNDYVSRPGQKDAIPVQRDDAGVEDPIGDDADSDEALGMLIPSNLYPSPILLCYPWWQLPF